MSKETTYPCGTGRHQHSTALLAAACDATRRIDQRGFSGNAVADMERYKLIEALTLFMAQYDGPGRENRPEIEAGRAALAPFGYRPPAYAARGKDRRSPTGGIAPLGRMFVENGRSGHDRRRER